MASKRVGSLRLALIKKDKIVRQELLLAVGQTAKLYQKSLNIVIRNWKIDVRFILDTSVIPNLIEVMIKADGQDKEIWGYVDKGTGQFRAGGAPYEIRPKGAKPLRFRTGYDARTQPVGKFNVGTGQATGSWVSKYSVIHPGIKPREFMSEISKTLLPIYIKNIKAALIRADKR